ncbi:MAG: hypothetical protein HY266_09425 [Deltaproteobacteria bacterium]|nr:hypothetical protein [Deltaproteobacteria bacterium]
MRQFFVALFIFAFILFLAAVAVFFLLVDTKPMGRLEYLNSMARVTAFRFTGMPKLDEAETKFLYNGSCTRKCHSKDVVERARHTSREWEEVVKRMRFVHGAWLTDNEATQITHYLQKNYLSTIPTILSNDANRFLKQYLWRSDFGESDLYVDVIYAPREYYNLTGGVSDAEKYNVDEYTVFLIYLNTHQERFPPPAMDKMAVLKDKDGRMYEPIDWKVSYESGDLHHREGILRFKKIKSDTGFMELVLRDLPGQKERLFRWDLPVPEFKGK